MATAPKKPGSAVAKAEPKKFAIQVTEDVDVNMLTEDAASGHGFSRDDLTIAYLRVLQKGSPEVNKRDEKFIEGAEPGMFINSLSQQVYEGEEEGINIVPVLHTPSYIAWKLREKGGGLVRDYGADASIMLQTVKNDKGQDVLKTDPTIQVVRSALYFVQLVNIETGESEQLAFSLASTQLKKARKWNMNMETLQVPHPSGSTFNPAMFYMVYNVKTVYEENDKGDWFGVTVPEPVMPTINLPYGSGLYMECRHLKDAIKRGEVKVKPPEDEVVDAKIIPADGSEDLDEEVMPTEGGAAVDEDEEEMEIPTPPARGKPGTTRGRQNF